MDLCAKWLRSHTPSWTIPAGWLRPRMADGSGKARDRCAMKSSLNGAMIEEEPLRYEERLGGLPIFENCWAPLCLATTEVSSCHNRHLVSPQRTSFLAAADTPRGKRGCPQSRIPNPIGDCENGQTNGLVRNHIQGSLPRPDFPAPILFLLRLEDCDCDYKKMK